jgi:hypothetical protein
VSSATTPLLLFEISGLLVSIIAPFLLFLGMFVC